MMSLRCGREELLVSSRGEGFPVRLSVLQNDSATFDPASFHSLLSFRLNQARCGATIHYPTGVPQ